MVSFCSLPPLTATQLDEHASNYPPVTWSSPVTACQARILFLAVGFTHSVEGLPRRTPSSFGFLPTGLDNTAAVLSVEGAILPSVRSAIGNPLRRDLWSSYARP